MSLQESWLNKMADKGFRLIRTEKLLYEFEECKSCHVKYCVEFIAPKSMDKSRDYYDFLEDMGYRLFYKNINLNYAIGKLRWRPCGEKGGHIATDATTFFTVISSSVIFGMISVMSLICVLIYQGYILKNKYASKIKEW